MNIEEKIISKIKEENLKPKSLWYFLVRDYSLWSLVLISVILASFAIAPIIFIFQNIELGYAKHITENVYGFIFLVFPYPWVILCTLTTYLAIKAWEKTRNGYKFEGKYIFVYSFLTSLLLGSLLNIWNFGRFMDNEIKSASFGNYKNFQERRNEAWFNPEGGRIFGSVSEVSSTSFILYNIENNFTQAILFDDSVIGIENVFENNNVRIVGFEKNISASEKQFFACVVFPDKIKPNRGDRKNFLDKNKLENRLNIHEECENIFEQGRAFFKPKPGEKFLK